jgi:hypothetical protein
LALSQTWDAALEAAIDDCRWDSMAARQRKTKTKDKDKPAKVVWRISASAPLGEYVRTEPEPANETPLPATTAVIGEPREIPERGWHHSTHELAHGMDMSEESLDTLPDDLFDQFFKKEP